MPKSIHRSEYTVLRDLIREARLAAGLTQTEVSAELGRSQSFISDVERGVRRLDLIELLDLSRLFDRDFVKLTAEFIERVRKLDTAESPARRKSSKLR